VRKKECSRKSAKKGGHATTVLNHQARKGGTTRRGGKKQFPWGRYAWQQGAADRPKNLLGTQTCGGRGESAHVKVQWGRLEFYGGKNRTTAFVRERKWMKLQLAVQGGAKPPWGERGDGGKKGVKVVEARLSCCCCRGAGGRKKAELSQGKRPTGSAGLGSHKFLPAKHYYGKGKKSHHSSTKLPQAHRHNKQKKNLDRY